MAKKYIKNEKGIVRAVTSENLQLEKPLLNENYDIDVHNRNMDKIDNAIHEVKGKIDGLELVASNVKMNDGSTVEETVSGNKANIGGLYQLQTSDKSNLVNAINEVFQSANNGKELIANAIGEPLSKEDTFNAMSSDINGLLSIFKTNMLKNGVTVDSGDKFKQLIDKIATMTEEGSGKGIQFAEGTVSISVSDKLGGRTTDSDALKKRPMNQFSIVTDFKPIYILISNNEFKYEVYSAHRVIKSYFETSNDTYLNYTSPEAYRRDIADHKTSSSDKLYFDRYVQVTSNGFDFYTRFIHVYNNVFIGDLVCTVPFKWYAIGIGEEDTTLRDSLASILINEGVNITENDDMASLIIKVEELINRNKKIDIVNS